MDPLENAFGLSRCDIHYDECWRGDELFGLGCCGRLKHHPTTTTWQFFVPFLVWWSMNPSKVKWPPTRGSKRSRLESPGTQCLQLFIKHPENYPQYLRGVDLFSAVYLTGCTTSCGKYVARMVRRLCTALWRTALSVLHFCLEVQGTLVKYHNHWEKL